MGSGRPYAHPCSAPPPRSAPRWRAYAMASALGLLSLLGLLLRSSSPVAAANLLDDSRRCDIESYISAGNAPAVLELDLKDCKLRTLPASIDQFASLKKLDLGRNELSDLPALPPTLEILFLLSNNFESIPASITRLQHLRMLSFKSNRLTSISAPLPTSIEWLILTDNQLADLPIQVRNGRLMRLSQNGIEWIPSAVIVLARASPGQMIACVCPASQQVTAKMSMRFPFVRLRNWSRCGS